MGFLGVNASGVWLESDLIYACEVGLCVGCVFGVVF